MQGVTFFLPRFLWTTFGEGGRMAFLTSGLLDLTADEEEVEWRLKKLLAGFQKVRGRNTKYALVFALFEILNLVNVIVQIYITDLFLHGKFLDYGSRLLSYYQDKDRNAMKVRWVFEVINEYLNLSRNEVEEIEDSSCEVIAKQELKAEEVFAPEEKDGKKEETQ